jgi:hypothetical protein
MMESTDPALDTTLTDNTSSSSSNGDRLSESSAINKDSAATESKEKKGWYPGKFLNKLTKKDQSKETREKELEDEAELKLRIEEERRSSFEKEEGEEKKQDSMISYCIRSIREKFMKRQLVGRIYIYRISGIISTAVTSDITPDDLAQYMIDHASEMALENDPLIQAELNGTYKRALSMTDTILNSLERRSLAYANAIEFGHSTLLTRGTTIGVSDPFIGLVNLSFTLELSATAKSLLESRMRFEAARDIALNARPDVNPSLSDRLGSMRESMSFSFFKSKDKGAQSADDSGADTSARSDDNKSHERSLNESEIVSSHANDEAGGSDGDCSSYVDISNDGNTKDK